MNGVAYIAGATGFVGSALARQATDAQWEVVSTTPGHEGWDADETALGRGFTAALRPAVTRSPGRPWVAIWAAGSGVIASDPTAFAGEQRALRAWLDAVTDVLLPRRGVVHIVSSAGGVFGGADQLPVDRSRTPCPVNAYGIHKLACESIAIDSLASRAAVHVGRYTTLYGATQRPGKPQGLIRKLCQSALTGEPVAVYVPLSTRRDFLHVDDATRAAWQAMMIHLQGVESGALGVNHDLIALGVSHSIGDAIAIIERASGRRIAYRLGGTAVAGDVRDHWFAPSVSWGLQVAPPRSLSLGVAHTLAHLAD